MRLTVFILGLGLALGIYAQEPSDPPAETVDPTPTAPTLPPDTVLERHLPAEQQRRLGEAENAFLTLWLPAARAEPRGAILLVGDHGEHADWPELLAPARRQLSEAGWNTLSMSLPAAAPVVFGLDDEAVAERAGAREADLSARLQLGLDSLKGDSEGDLPTIIIARGQAAHWALKLDAEALGIDALVLFRPRAPTMLERQFAEQVAAWEKPLLELLPGAGGARAGHHERALAARRLDRSGYVQWHIGDLRGAPETQTILIRRLQGWLERVSAN